MCGCRLHLRGISHNKYSVPRKMHVLYLTVISSMFRSLRRLVFSSLCLVSAMSTAQAEVVVVLNSRDATVQLLDQKTYAPLSTFAVGKEPHHLMETPDGKSLIVASSVGNELIFLDPVVGPDPAPHQQHPRPLPDRLFAGPEVVHFELAAPGPHRPVPLRRQEPDPGQAHPAAEAAQPHGVHGRQQHGLHHAAGQQPGQRHRPGHADRQVDACRSAPRRPVSP